MSVEGYPVTGVDVDGVALHAVLLQLLLLGAEAEARGHAPLPQGVGVRLQLAVHRPGQLTLRARVLQLPGGPPVVDAVVVPVSTGQRQGGGGGGGGGTRHDEVGQPQEPDQEEGLGQQAQFPRAAAPHGGAAPPAGVDGWRSGHHAGHKHLYERTRALRLRFMLQ